MRPVDIEHNHQGSCHEQQGQGEKRIYLTDNLVDRQHGGNNVVGKDDDHPHQDIASQGMENLCRRIDKHSTHHDEQQDREDQRHALSGIAQIPTDQFRQAGPIVSHGQHATQIVMGSTRKDTTKHNPKISHRTELGTHDSTKDRACTGNVQELNHKNLPVGKYHKVQSVRFCDGWRRTVIRSEHPFHKASIEQIAQDKSHQAHTK